MRNSIDRDGEYCDDHEISSRRKKNLFLNSIDSESSFESFHLLWLKIRLRFKDI